MQPDLHFDYQQSLVKRVWLEGVDMDSELSDQHDFRDGESRWLRSLDVAQMISFEVDILENKAIRKGALCEKLDIEQHGSPAKFLKRVHPDDRERLKSVREQSNVESPSYTVTYRFTQMDGSECWLREDADVIFDDLGHKSHLVGTCRDVTAEHVARRELETQRRQLKAITDATPALIAYIDADQRYQFVNATYATEFGKSIDEIVGTTVQEVVGDARYKQIRPQVEAALAGEKQTCEVVFGRIKRRSSSLQECNLRSRHQLGRRRGRL